MLPLADFGIVSFTGCAFNGQPISAFDWRRIDMVSGGGVTEAVASPLGSDGASFFVSDDFTPPSTKVSGAATRWHNAPVSLTFIATDDPGGSGVAATEYSLDGGATWTDGTSVTIPAPADQANDGLHAVLFRSTDSAGNVEDRPGVKVGIDTQRPN